MRINIIKKFEEEQDENNFTKNKMNRMCMDYFMRHENYDCA